MDMGQGKGQGEGGTNGESNIDIYHSMCEIESQWEFSVGLRELKQGLCDRLNGGMEREMGGRFKREGIYVYMWLIHVEV